MQFQEIVTQVATLLNRDDIEDEIPSWINMVRLEMSQLDPLPEDFVRATMNTTSTNYQTISGEHIYAYPCDYLWHYNLTIRKPDNDEYALTKLDGRRFDNLKNSGFADSQLTATGQGAPTYYVERGLGFRLVPDANREDYTLVLQYYSTPVEVSGPAEPSQFVRFYNAIIMGACKFGALALKDAELLQLYNAEFGAVLRRLVRITRHNRHANKMSRVKTLYDMPLAGAQRFMNVT